MSHPPPPPPPPPHAEHLSLRQHSATTAAAPGASARGIAAGLQTHMQVAGLRRDRHGGGAAAHDGITLSGGLAEEAGGGFGGRMDVESLVMAAAATVGGDATAAASGGGGGDVELPLCGGNSHMDVLWERSVAAQGASRGIWADAAAAATAEAQAGPAASGAGVGGAVSSLVPSGMEHVDLGLPIR